MALAFGLYLHIPKLQQPRLLQVIWTGTHTQGNCCNKNPTCPLGKQTASLLCTGRANGNSMPNSPLREDPQVYHFHYF